MSYSKSKSWIDVENGPFSFIESDITNEVFIISDENDNPIDNFNQKWFSDRPPKFNITIKTEVIKDLIELEKRLNEFLNVYKL